MNKILYVSNIEVPYRSEFFNQLSKKVDLTVLYERKKSSNRDSKWTSSVKSNYKVKYLKGINVKNEYNFDLGIFKHIFSKNYDSIIIGCYNSPIQMLAIIIMKLFQKKYILNLDGEYFFDGKGIKNKIKRFFIKGASEYLVAGDKAGEILSKYVPIEKVHSYYFSSLTKKELEENVKHMNENINDKVIVIGQYFDYKGLDIAMEIAKLDQTISYRFIGSGKRSKLLEKKVNEMNLKNIEIIPFLSKKELYKEYQECRCLLLTSRKECWGLVINEAASFGCPIFASKNCGASVEIIDKRFQIDVESELSEIVKLINNTDKYYDRKEKCKLIERNKNYSIENSVIKTADTIDNGVKL